MEYYVVQSDHLDTLDEQVNERLKQGWELQGGVSVCVIPSPTDPQNFWYTYVQAIVKRTDETSQKGAAGLTEFRR